MTKARVAAALCLGLILQGCGISSPSDNRVETFSGSVQPLNFGVSHPFSVTNVGSREIKITLTSLVPGNAFLGILYGQPAGNGCGAFQTAVVDTTAGRNSLTGFIQIAGQYCVQVFDPVNTVGIPLPVTQNYTLQVSHP